MAVAAASDNHRLRRPPPPFPPSSGSNEDEKFSECVKEERKSQNGNMRVEKKGEVVGWKMMVVAFHQGASEESGERIDAASVRT
ncbi:hypothetical protein CDL12_01295 [Handroanthus impetiginosus]|uniref:Uncharacterized protein n=1 Tax=Handroanthus impetiginosus TaxID=429701 RepID=A0A2G9I882_9LAMI|nr:hypothetical protein CDL12_01295 [Handroanthus impetiginosus]